jgi:hypothetical protein
MVDVVPPGPDPRAELGAGGRDRAARPTGAPAAASPARAADALDEDSPRMALTGGDQEVEA